jgi:hypothetical protein
LAFNLALRKSASTVGVFWGDFARREPTAHEATMAERTTACARKRLQCWVNWLW